MTHNLITIGRQKELRVAVSIFSLPFPTGLRGGGNGLVGEGGPVSALGRGEGEDLV